MKRTALIDGDIFVFAAAAANEYECQWDDFLWTLHSELPPAIAQLDSMIGSIVTDLQADAVAVALTDSHNWRKDVMPSYKSNRAKTRKPIVYKALRQYIEETYECYQRPGLEGDDVLGILATHPYLIQGEKIIVSLDKDMKTIPGYLLNDGKARQRMAEDSSVSYLECVETITEEEADYNHLMQTLTGDSTDGYPGCPGYGPVKAAALLAAGKVLVPQKHVLKSGPRKGQEETRWVAGPDGSTWEIIVSAYQAAGLGEEVALENARVARICRHQDYDFKKKETKLWKPA